MLTTQKSLTVCIIDDEEGIRKNLKNQFAFLQLPVSVTGEADSVSTGVALLQEKQPDIAFLDIEMPDGKGFDILRQLADIPTKIIFITAFNQYAVEAFRFSALDYLLKPIDSEELEEAVRKARNLLEQQSYQFRLGVFLNNMEDISTKYKKLVLKNSDSIFAVNISEIIHLQAFNNYTTFFLEKQSPIVVSKTLKEYEETLSRFGFYRIHQSHLINLNFFSRYDKKDGGVVVLKDKTTLPISAKKKEGLFEFLENL
jgi:two-component system LytT family response regulator